MDQTTLKKLLENVIHEIEGNGNITLDEIIYKLSIEMQSHLQINEVY